MRVSFVLSCAIALFAMVLPLAAQSQSLLPLPRPVHAPRTVASAPAAISPAPVTTASPSGLIAEVTLADIGFVNGLRFANLGGHREIFVPLPQGGDVAASDLVLVLDDVSAHDARRNLEVQVNDRTVAAIALDGKSRGRTVRVPLGKTKPKDGYLKLSFLYSGAATLDRCIDVRYVGDSLTIGPETAVEVDVGPRRARRRHDGRADAARRRGRASRAAASRQARSRPPSRSHARSSPAAGMYVLSRLRRRCRNSPSATTDGRWTRGVILVGPLADAAGVVDSPVARVAGRSSAVWHARRRSRRRVRRRFWSPTAECRARRRLVRESVARRHARHRGGIGRRSHAGRSCRPIA